MAGTPLRLAYLADPNSIHTRRWLAFFAGRGHDVRLLVAEDQVIEPGLAPSIAVERFNSYGARLRPLGAWRARRSLQSALHRIEPDIVHAHYLTRYGWLAWLAGARPLVVTVWGTDVLLTPARSPVARRLAAWTLRRAALVTGVSPTLLEAAVALGADRQRTMLAQFGVDGQVFCPGPPSTTLRDALVLGDRRVVFSPRAIAPLYRQDVVVDALARLPPDVVAIFTERNARPAALAALRSRIAGLGLDARIRIVPGADEERMADLYRLADVVVSVPESDAFPVTALEAMASERPIVLTDLPAARDALPAPGDFSPAVGLVPVGDVAATAGAIRAVLQADPARLAERAVALRHLALELGDRARDLLAVEAAYRRIARS